MSIKADPGVVVIGVDVGGTKTHAAVIDRHLNVVHDLTVPTQIGGVDQVGAGIVSAVAALESNGQRLAGVGIGLPGIVDSSAGSVRHAFNLGIGEDALDIVSRLSTAVSAPCWIANDVDAAALGVYEILRRDNRALRDLVFLSIGTGIAAGVILDGRIYQGNRGFAGEIGHFLADPGGPECACGLRGCLEAMASGTGPRPPMASVGPTLVGGGALRRRGSWRRRSDAHPGARRRAPHPRYPASCPHVRRRPHRDRRRGRRRWRLSADRLPSNKACTASRAHPRGLRP